MGIPHLSVYETKLFQLHLTSATCRSAWVWQTSLVVESVGSTWLPNKLLKRPPNNSAPNHASGSWQARSAKHSEPGQRFEESNATTLDEMLNFAQVGSVKTVSHWFWTWNFLSLKWSPGMNFWIWKMLGVWLMVWNDSWLVTVQEISSTMKHVVRYWYWQYCWYGLKLMIRQARSCAKRSSESTQTWNQKGLEKPVNVGLVSVFGWPNVNTMTVAQWLPASLGVARSEWVSYLQCRHWGM